jgi:6-phosphogluconolactonase
MNHYHIGQDAAEVSMLMADYLRQELASSRRFSWALSGGSTPKVLFRILAEKAGSGIDWSRLEFFWGDERCVPPTDEESNYYWANRLLFEPVGLDKDQVHRIRGESAHLKMEADRYGGLIEQECLYHGGLDLVMLGMGADGHTASVFPGQEDLWETDEFAVISEHPQSGQKRISLTRRAILCSRNVAFLITGESKAEILEEIMNRRAGYEAYPTSWVLKLGKPVHWFLDREASRYLNIG